MSRSRKKASAKIKLRNSIRISFIMFSFIVFAFSSSVFIKSVHINNSSKVEENLYTYQNDFKMNYDVNIKNNPFVLEDSLPSGQTYVSDLIDTLDITLNYKYSGSTNSHIKYNYKVDAILDSTYKENGKDYSVWNKTYNLLSKEDLQSENNILFDENFKVDYKKYHQEIKNFKQSFGMALESRLYIKLTVNTQTIVKNQEINNEYVSDFSITLGDKIAVVNGKNNDVKIDSFKQENIINDITMNIPKVIISMFTMGISLYVIYYIKFKTKKYNTIKNEFKLELNKILKSCQDKIVIVKTNNIDENENIIDVYDFGELIKLSEELYKPILCWISDDLNNQEACFSVISNKVRYRFILKK